MTFADDRGHPNPKHRFCIANHGLLYRSIALRFLEDLTFDHGSDDVRGLHGTDTRIFAQVGFVARTGKEQQGRFLFRSHKVRMFDSSWLDLIQSGSAGPLVLLHLPFCSQS